MSRILSSLGAILTLAIVLVLPDALAAQITPQHAADALRLREVGPAVAGGGHVVGMDHAGDHVNRRARSTTAPSVSNRATRSPIIRISGAPIAPI